MIVTPVVPSSTRLSVGTGATGSSGQERRGLPPISLKSERRKPPACPSGNWKTSLSVNADSIARSENFGCAPRRQPDSHIRTLYETPFVLTPIGDAVPGLVLGVHE